jgi:hypothetical protein
MFTEIRVVNWEPCETHKYSHWRKCSFIDCKSRWYIQLPLGLGRVQTKSVAAMKGE